MSSDVIGGTRMRRYFARLWSREASLTALLVFLTLTLFVFGPLTAGGGPMRAWSDLGFGLVLIAGVFAVSRAGWFSWLFATLVVGGQVLHWLVVFNQDRHLAAADAVWSLVLFGMLIPAVMVEIFREGQITAHRIQGAVAVYMLLGLIWAFAYKLIELEIPGAVRLSRPVSSPSELTGELVYFSFVTLTSTGFGDVTPVHPVARSAAVLEALTGQLFLAILIARLVSLQLAGRPR
jgi:hypothetical protein